MTGYRWSSLYSAAPRAAGSVRVGRGGGLAEDGPELLRGCRRRGRAGAVERQARKRRLMLCMLFVRVAVGERRRGCRCCC